MQDDPAPLPGPAHISPQAEALIAQAATRPRRDFTRPMDDLRAEGRAYAAPFSQAAIARTGVTVSEAQVCGLDALVIDPPLRRGNRRILYFFGGGFVLGSPFEDLPIAAALAAGTGAQVIAPAYPLAPEHPFPAAFDACTAIACAVLAETPDTALAGESAGGNLALGAAQALRAAGGPQPVALALISPGADTSGRRGDSYEADRDPFIRSDDSGAFRARYLPPGTDARDPRASPIFGAFGPDFPPTVITTGTRDLLLSVCCRLDRVMREAGADTRLRVWEGMWHVFEWYDIPEAQASLTDIAGYLDARFTTG